MIRKVIIKNFKSITELELDLGRINVFIGANGSGKSNILEAIAFGGAAAADKLDNEYFYPRGIRMVEPELMFSAFNPINSYITQLAFDNNRDSKDPITFNLINKSKKLYSWNDSDKPDNFSMFRNEKGLTDFGNEEFAKWFIKNTASKFWGLDRFLIFSPNENTLREFKAEGPILPLGRSGEGLFKLLTEMNKEGFLVELKQHLSVLDWYENFEIGNGNFASERFLEIKDRFIDKDLKYFDQRSANEGFLFLLFYLALFISKDTPSFFAIENIDTSLNPKLCRKLTEVLNQLATEHNKQALITTHNPTVLDGLNINDDEQRLFVVERNQLGHTCVNRIKTKEGKSLGIKLSEAFMNGYLGGLPINF